MGDESVTTGAVTSCVNWCTAARADGAEGEPPNECDPERRRARERSRASPSERRRALPRSAAAYGVAIGIAALAADAAVPRRVSTTSQTSKWTTFGDPRGRRRRDRTPTRCARPRDTAFHTSWVFLIPSAILLPPELVALLGVVMHVPGVAEGALRLVHPELQHLQLHARQPRDVGGGRAAARRERARSPTTISAGRSPASPPASSPSARTTSCSRRW